VKRAGVVHTARRAGQSWSAERIDRGLLCPVCSTPSVSVGNKYGEYARTVFAVMRCPACHFAYVRDPIASPDIYDEAYYRGHGADTAVDYVYELEHPDKTVRAYEWKGVAEIVQGALGARSSPARWLDYGCGTGGLVRHARALGFDAWGFEEGFGAQLARKASVPLLDRAALATVDRFDVVTAIEVLEHVFDVNDFLRSVRRMLAPGGLFFYTTGNPEGRRGRSLLSWGYLVPEVHVSFYEPRTMERALHNAGFRAQYLVPSAGHAEIVRYKVLKVLGLKAQLPGGLPWGLRAMSPVVRAVTGVLAHPIGIAV